MVISPGSCCIYLHLNDLGDKNNTASCSAAPTIVADALVNAVPAMSSRSTALTLDVEPGTVFGLLGPNGAGKSTTVKILTTLARPDAGHGERGGIDVRPRAGAGAARDRVRRAEARPSTRGDRPREPASCRAACTASAARPAPPGRRAARPLRPDRAADRSRRRTRAACSASSTSPWAWCTGRSVLFLDEPTTGLDPEARAELWAEIRRLAGEDGLTSCSPPTTSRRPTGSPRQLAIVDHGRVVAEGTRRAQGELRGDAILVELAEPSRPARRVALDRSPACGSR